MVNVDTDNLNVAAEYRRVVEEVLAEKGIPATLENQCLYATILPGEEQHIALSPHTDEGRMLFKMILREIQRPDVKELRAEIAEALLERLTALQREKLGEYYEEAPLGPLFRFNRSTEASTPARHTFIPFEEAETLATIDSPYIFLAGNHWGKRETKYTQEECEITLGKFVSFLTKRLGVLGVDISADDCLMYTYSAQQWEGEKRMAEMSLLIGNPANYYSDEAMKFAQAMLGTVNKPQV